MRSYSEVEKDYYAAFQELATQCKVFLGHRETFRSWLEILLYHHGLSNLDLALNRFKILVHMDLSFSRDSELFPKFQEFVLTLKHIDSLNKELEALTVQSVRQEPLMIRS
jgi:hypothetical protein